jgi:hypothetical protein
MLMTEQYWTVAFAGAAAVIFVIILFAVLTYASLRALRRESLSRGEVGELLRREGDAIRATAEQQSSLLRRDLGNALTQFHTGTVASVSALSKEIMERVGAFGDRLEASNKIIEGRVEGIGAKLNDDLGSMAHDAAENRDRLRASIDAKLNESREQQV